MKLHSVLITLLALLVALTFVPPPLANAQFTINARTNLVENSGQLTAFELTADTTGSDTSYAFTLSGYDLESFSTYPIIVGKLQTSASGKPRLTTYIYGTFNGSDLVLVDTVGIISDSLETMQWYSIDLNNKHYPYYKLRVVGESGNLSDVTTKLWVYAYQHRRKY